uniref:Uncharacterized protein n=1 Tax=Timema douglasi TaxID=61478 RepID=A0A7R8VLL7_TIMDO|nr:unnamed protein product [Timema douglasi]
MVPGSLQALVASGRVVQDIFLPPSSIPNHLVMEAVVLRPSFGPSNNRADRRLFLYAEECCLVKERQRVVALHLYYRRAQEQEESDRKPDGRHALRDRSGEDLSGAVREQMLYESLLAMRRVFPVGEEAVPLLLCILKQSRSLQEASWKIIQEAVDIYLVLHEEREWSKAVMGKLFGVGPKEKG